MSTTELTRLSGFSMALGAVLGFLTILYGALFFAGDPTATAGRPGYALVYLIEFVGVGLILIGLPLVYATFADRGGVLALIGVALIFLTGLMFGIFFALLSTVLVPYLAEKAPNTFKGNGPPAFFPFFIVGTLASAVGPVLFAIPFLTGRVFPRWLGYVLVGSALFAVISFFLPSSSSNVLVSLVGSLSPLLLMVALGTLGYRVANREAADQI